MESGMKLSLKKQARARSMLTPESMFVGESAPKGQTMARVMPDMVGKTLFRDQVGDTEQPVLSVPLELVTKAKRPGRPRKQAPKTGGDAMEEAAELAQGGVQEQMGDTNHPVTRVPLQLVTTAKRGGRPRKEAAGGGNAMGEAGELAKLGVQKKQSQPRKKKEDEVGVVKKTRAPRKKKGEEPGPSEVGDNGAGVLLVPILTPGEKNAAAPPGKEKDVLEGTEGQIKGRVDVIAKPRRGRGKKTAVPEQEGEGIEQATAPPATKRRKKGECKQPGAEAAIVGAEGTLHWEGRGKGRGVPRLTKAEKGKSKQAPRKPKGWQPPTNIRPSAAVGVTTRARRTLDYQEKEKVDADAAIWDVLQCYPPSESEGARDSMATRNLVFEKHVFQEVAWTATTPLTRGGDQGGGARGSHRQVRQDTRPRERRGWDVARAGWAVLIPNRFISEYSFYTGDTPSWTLGDVVAEYEDVVAKKQMVVVELGGFKDHMHFPACDVRMAKGRDVRAQGSEGGHGYGWAKRRQNFGAAGVNRANLGQGSGAGIDPGEEPYSEEIADNGAARERWVTRPIEEYMEPSAEEAPDGTQESTARTVFPQVSKTLPDYMLWDENDGWMGEGDAAQQCEAQVSSGEEWIPAFEDDLGSEEEDETDYVPARPPLPRDFMEWCESTKSFMPGHLELHQLQAFYRAESWNADKVSLLGSRDNFCGPQPGYRNAGDSVPGVTEVFDLYWTPETLGRIVEETNRYAREGSGRAGDSRTKGGPRWKDVTVSELRAWLGVCILMGVKRLPAVKHYWLRGEGFIFCTLISSVMSLARWSELLRCLHLVNNRDVVRDLRSPQFDRIAKTRWIIDMFVGVSKEIYNLEREITVDECVIPYKGQYCFIRQFMKDKLVRFGIKCWVLASSKSRFVSNIEVYFGEGTGMGWHGLGYHVVMRLVAGLERRWHCLVVDNLFASVNLFHELMCLGYWATGTVRRSSKNLPSGLYRESSDKERGSMLIRTHNHRQMGVVSWQDKCLVTLLSTAASPWEPGLNVLRRVPGMRGQLIVPASPILLQYQEFMRGVDVGDQIRANYSSQLRSHKWWHKLFFFIVDQSVVNSYVVYVSAMESLGLKVPTHMHFNIAVGKQLVAKWLAERPRTAACAPPRQRRPGPVHSHWHSALKRKCVECGHVGRWYCPACGNQWMCPQSCYHVVHERLSRLPR